MESARSAADPGHSRPRRVRRRFGALVGAVCAITVILPTAAGHAGPDPSVKELKDQATNAQNQLEQLTERYNGLKVQLDQASRAAKVAGENAQRQQAAYHVMQAKIGQLAASSYMHAGADPAIAFATAQNPQSLLDQASTLNYFSAQNGSKVASLAQAMQSAVRARKAAEDRTTEVQTLKSQLEQQKKTLEQTYNQARDKIAKKDPSQLAGMPVFSGGSTKAMEALQWALRQRGKPYVWGAAGPDAFDCSGLTMWAYGQVGISLPHYTGSQWNSGTHVSRDQLQPGDLIFFYSDLHHMGMYIGNGMMLHAPHTGDVVRIAEMAGRPFAGAVRVA